MRFSISDIATALDARFEGDGAFEVTGPSEPQSASADALALAMDEKYAPGLAEGAAQAAILWDGADWQALGLKAAIFVPRPRYAMSGLTSLMDAGPDIEAGVHPTAFVHDSAQIGEAAAIGPFVMIGRDVKIGANARIASHVSIEAGAVIGDQALILNGVRIGHHVQIGDGFIGQPGCVIGADGLSFVTPEKSAAENVRKSLGNKGQVTQQNWTRIHSLGSVSIGNNVEIGANSTVDRGTIRNTSVGSGTKIDNLVQLGHNVQVGEDCLFCAHVGVGGSTKVGNRVVLAGKCGLNDNIFVGDDVVAGGASKLFTNVPAGRVVLGNPAVKMETQIEIQKAVRRLPRFMKAQAARK